MRPASAAPLPACAAALLIAALNGCGHGPVVAKTASRGAPPPSCSTDAGALDAALEAAPEPMLPARRWRREGGCARGWAPSGKPQDDVAALGRLCAEGAVAMLAPDALVSAVRGRSATVQFEVNAPTCLYAAAAAVSGAVALWLLGPQGEPLASIWSSDSAVLAPPDGPICVREPGVYQLRIDVPLAGAEAGAVTIAPQVWQTTTDR